MDTSIGIPEKKRGRPSTGGRKPGVMLRLSPDELAALDRHIDALPDPKPTRPEAIRRILAAGLSAAR